MKTVLIAGAGIIGLATALELAGRGCDVTVIERGGAMQEASWAAAGMLAAHDPENPRQLAPLAQFSLSLYPEFLQRIERLSGHAVPLRTTHTLQICRPGEVQDFRQMPSGQVLTAQQAAARIPGFTPPLGATLLWLEEQSLDPRDLCRSLPIAARRAGVRLVEHCAVDAIAQGANGITAIAGAERYRADALVVCCGAWSQRLMGSGLADDSLCVPRKGQILRLRQPTGPRLKTVLRSSDVYIVPRGEGSLVVGATVEDAGFDRAVRSEATAWLLGRAAALWPPIGDLQHRNGLSGDTFIGDTFIGGTFIGDTFIEEVWTGLRPTTADHLPILGALDDPRWLLATGHYRNGILLAPATGRVIASLLLQEKPEIDISAFHPARLLHLNAKEPLAVAAT